jgi:hypothetical protein
MEPEGSLLCSLLTIPSRMNTVYTTLSYFSKIRFNIILSRLSLPSGSFLQAFPLKSYIHFSSPPYVLHALGISIKFTLPYD